MSAFSHVRNARAQVEHVQQAGAAVHEPPCGVERTLSVQPATAPASPSPASASATRDQMDRFRFDSAGDAHSAQHRPKLKRSQSDPHMFYAITGPHTHGGVPSVQGSPEPVQSGQTMSPTIAADAMTLASPPWTVTSDAMAAMAQSYAHVERALYVPIREGIVGSTHQFASLLTGHDVTQAIQAYLQHLMPYLVPNQGIGMAFARHAHDVLRAMGGGDQGAVGADAHAADQAQNPFPIPVVMSCFEICLRGVHGAIPELSQYPRRRELIAHAKAMVDGFEVIGNTCRDVANPDRGVIVAHQLESMAQHWQHYMVLLSEFLRTEPAQVHVQPGAQHQVIDMDGLTLTQEQFHALMFATPHDLPALAHAINAEAPAMRFRRAAVWRGMEDGLAATPPRYRFAVEALGLLQHDLVACAALLHDAAYAHDFDAHVTGVLRLDDLHDRFVEHTRQLRMLHHAYEPRHDQWIRRPDAAGVQHAPMAQDAAQAAEQPVDTRLQTQLMAGAGVVPITPIELLQRLHAMGDAITSLMTSADLDVGAALSMQMRAIMARVAACGDDQVALADTLLDAYRCLSEAIQQAREAIVVAKLGRLLASHAPTTVRMKTGGAVNGVVHGVVPYNPVAVARDFWFNDFQAGVSLHQTRASLRQVVPLLQSSQQLAASSEEAGQACARGDDRVLRRIVAAALMRRLLAEEGLGEQTALPELWAWDQAQLTALRVALSGQMMLAAIMASLPPEWRADRVLSDALLNTAMARMLAMQHAEAAHAERPLLPLQVAQCFVDAFRQTWADKGVVLSPEKLQPVGESARRVAAWTTRAALASREHFVAALCADLEMPRTHDDRIRYYGNTVLARAMMDSVDGLRQRFEWHYRVCKPFYQRMLAPMGTLADGMFTDGAVHDVDAEA